MAKKKNPSANTPVEAHIHKKDKRTNIPTAELKDFVKEDEARPKKILYPRDPSLDPQLVWKGKDEQDQKPSLFNTSKKQNRCQSYQPLWR